MIAVAFAFATHCLALIFSFTAGATADDLTPDQSFRDCLVCPDMVVVPAGSFDMGTALAQTDGQSAGWLSWHDATLYARWLRLRTLRGHLR